MAKKNQAEKLAILGGEKTVTAQKAKWPVSDEKDVETMAELVRSGAWSWIGKHEKAFCEEYAKYHKTKYCACLANGTVTMQCALQALGVKPGDEVIVPGMTWVATAQAAFDVGANVVFVDVDPETLCIDPAKVEAAITGRTKAIVPVHLYGCMADMDAIMDIAKHHGLKVVEDVAHQHGGEWRGRKAGSIGDVGSFSFQLSKILTSGEGGAIVCNDAEVFKTIFAIKQVGWAPADPKNDLWKLSPSERYGRDFRITEFQCALLRSGLTRLDEQNATREANAKRISDALAKAGGPLRAAKRDKRVTRQAYYAMNFHFDPAKAKGVTLQTYQKALGAEGVGFGFLYPPPYRSNLLNLNDPVSPIPYRGPATHQDYQNLRLPVVEKALAETALVLDQISLLSDKKYIDQLIAAILKVNASLDELSKLKN